MRLYGGWEPTHYVGKGLGMKKLCKFSELVGKTLSKVDVIEDNDFASFETIDGVVYEMFHLQDCCESVSIEDVCGDVTDLLYTPILKATEETNPDEAFSLLVPSYAAESHTWTFYRISTIAGTVVIRWFGSSNGYYSEGVDFYKREP
jgi:hypothetical protein